MSKTWNSINPATLSGAIDVIVVEQEDGIVCLKSKAILQKLLTHFQAHWLVRPFM